MTAFASLAHQRTCGFFSNAARLAGARGARRVCDPLCARLEQRVVALRRRRGRHYPSSRLVGSRTEQIAAHTGAGIGGFLNATFGNAAELLSR